jgi:hypothetical protein
VVAGVCWGNNTEAYCRAFGATDRDAAGASAARLMRDATVRARIAFLRDESVERMGVDRLWILEKRKHIAEHSRNAADRLRALEDLEDGGGQFWAICRHDGRKIQDPGRKAQQHPGCLVANENRDSRPGIS